MPPKYKHTQKGGFWFYFVVVLFSSLLTLHFTGIIDGDDPIPNLVIYCVAIPLMLYSVLMMSSLTVTLDENSIRIGFGGGLAFHKRYPVKEMTECRVVRNHWFWGWGIRRYFRGWLYNIGGLDAVEIHFKNGKQVRIGTDEPQQLQQALQQVIS